MNRRGPPSMPRAALGIHGLRAGAATGLEKSEKRGVQAARNGPSEDGKCWQRIELGIHGLRAGAATGLEKSEKRGVQAARNGPSLPPCVAKAEMSTADRLGSRERSSRAGWRELLTPWGDERARSLSHRGAVSFKWSSGSHQCPRGDGERGRGHPLSGTREPWVARMSDKGAHSALLVARSPWSP